MPSFWNRDRNRCFSFFSNTNGLLGINSKYHSTYFSFKIFFLCCWRHFRCLIFPPVTPASPPSSPPQVFTALLPVSMSSAFMHFRSLVNLFQTVSFYSQVYTSWAPPPIRIPEEDLAHPGYWVKTAQRETGARGLSKGRPTFGALSTGHLSLFCPGTPPSSSPSSHRTRLGT